MIIINKNHKEKISIEFPESMNLEKSYFKETKGDPLSYWEIKKFGLKDSV